MVYDLFNVLLDVVYQYVVEDFIVHVYQQLACSFLSLVSLSSFGIRMMLAS